ncbi:Pro-apoptotic serine protease NMA111 [Metschnikowia bicuspidata var. bicuspidata NRRL YB-4993]|uniref:Pro-apoptotic serine protease NMA111 n=1 Tax=Metschnikowia bicuspidata var. bicuspidata NRRL YB-4993 TaxID=869754 RepID=A0A1A0HI67_9ASCO|nr:Pro-apoptotic serine protease NMA111 [Metschnikowia bicuspidata var. bicuspidata NRRL YB-4993]OBA23577.1 Pro-apoptotic serine protease NMA111 [Metschnikowia bicuspidata var. bicuspidata NRRL YB-4993]
MFEKRKASNGYEDRPFKKQAPVASDSELDEYVEEEEINHQVFDVAAGNNTAWSETITKVIKSVVSVHFSNITNFDTEVCLTSEATGFVVDATRGIILTNRHVVGPGPFCGYAVFDNHEEAVVKPIYRDPIHDFGFLQFNPAEIKHMVVSELELRPDLAKVGTEIRVVGNDAGEKLSILAGFISRLDRNAPFYGSMTYNDFNTEYIQAAASASGGSSGSPVVNESGQAVALQAGGSTEASTDFFLPVYRPLRALKCIQEGIPVTRGDIQVEWLFRPFDECRRLGLTPESEARARELFPDKSGLLVCDIVLPEGPADGFIKEGDTLISINGEHISTFIKVDVILDDNVGKELEFVIQRGGNELKQKITIGDLHAITPNRFVDIAGASFNDLSYQLARCYCIPVKGVYVNDASGTFDFNGLDNTGWVLDKINDKPTPDLDTFIEVMKAIPDREKVAASFRHLSDLHTKNNMVLYLDRHWQSEFRVATRNDVTGLWDFKSLQDKPLPPTEMAPQKTRFVDIPVSGDDRAACSKLSRSFVQIRSFCPIAIDGYPFRKSVGHGVVIDAENGYVLVSRRFVPHDVCDIYLIFADSVDIPGKVVFLHPNLNYAIVKYDTSLVKADIQSPKIASASLKRGEKSLFIGYNYRHRIVTDDVSASSVSALNIMSSNINPRYRATNLEVVLLDSKIAQECDTGILVDNDGTLRAFWLTFLGDQADRSTNVQYRVALDVVDIKSVIDLLKQNDLPRSLRILDAEFATITVFLARARGVPQEWIERFEQECPDEVKLLSALRISARRSDKEISPLKFSDILLTVNDKLVTGMRDLRPMYNNKELKFKIVREMQVMDIVVPTVETDSINTSRILFWCGALLHEPHHGVRQLMENIPSRVYVSRKSSGGPMAQYGILTSVFITHVNDVETEDLETFARVTSSIPDNTYVKLRLVSYDHVPGAVSMKTNYHYFPTQELRVDDKTGEWIEIEHK